VQHARTSLAVKQAGHENKSLTSEGVSMTAPVQLIASVAKGVAAAPTVANPDGSNAPFTIPTGKTFVVTDISIQRLSVLGSSELVEVALRQDIPTGGTTNRWAFIGSTTTNVERSFVSGIAFSTPFVVTNGTQSTDVAVVRLWGFFQ
jgi:hypothetical protein